MNHRPFYPIITILLFSLLLFTCKKKEAEPEESQSPNSTLDYRNQYCGSYNVTFTTTASGTSVTEKKLVTVRKAEAGEKAFSATEVPLQECVTLLNLPVASGGSITAQIDAAGKSDGANLDVNLNSKKFTFYYLHSSGGQTKTFWGEGTMVQ